MSVAPARRVAFTVVRRVFEQGAFADRALHAEAGGLSTRDRALATTMAYGTVQRKRTLDHVLTALCDRPLERLDPPALAALRLGLHQILLLDGIPDRAAINESVELVKADRAPGGAGLVNAVLRRATRDGRGILEALDDDTPEHAAVLHSVPDWIARLWWEERGPDEARALLRAVNTPAESALRINSLREDEDVTLPVRSHGVDGLPEARVLEEPFDAFGSPLFAQGRVVPQSRASMSVARSLGPEAGERVLDLCAAPGGKTTHLAALMGDGGRIVAVEVHPDRAEALRRTCARVGAASVEVVRADGRSLPAELRGEGFDRVLVDPPCSGLGTLQGRPDLRWQERRGEIGALAERQVELLCSGAGALAPGGTLVYSVCTISRAESEGVVEAVVGQRPELRIDSTRQLTPARDGTDGFFIARLTRS